MQARARTPDTGLIDEWWRRDEAAAAAAMADGKSLDAARLYAAMTRDFAGLRDTAAVKALAQRAATSREARRERSHRQGEAQKSRDWLRAAMQIIADAFPAEAAAPLRTSEELARDLEIPRLKRAIAQPASVDSIEARRRLNELEVQLGFYLPEEASRTSQPLRASFAPK